MLPPLRRCLAPPTTPLPICVEYSRGRRTCMALPVVAVARCGDEIAGLEKNADQMPVSTRTKLVSVTDLGGVRGVRPLPWPHRRLDNRRFQRRLSIPAV